MIERLGGDVTPTYIANSYRKSFNTLLALYPGPYLHLV